MISQNVMKPINSYNKKLIIVQPYCDVDAISLRNFFLDAGWDVSIISPDEKHFHKRSVLLLPDTGGINANVSYFTREAKLPPNVPTQDQAMEFFRLETLSWYLKKREQGTARIGVLGIGYSAFLTFAECLGGSLYKNEDKLVFGHTTAVVDIEHDWFHSKTHRVAGLVQPPSMSHILKMAELLLKGGDGSVVPVTVPNKPRLAAT